MIDKNSKFKVYILRLENDLTPRYVGITISKLNIRLNRHKNVDRKKKTKNLHKNRWILKYESLVVIELIDTATNYDELNEKEIYYIKKFREEGIDLLNATDGGNGSIGFKHSEETIRKISGSNNHMYGKKHTDEWIEAAKKRVPINKGKKTNLPAWNRGIPLNDITKEKLRLNKLGKKDSDETKLKKSKSSKSYLRIKPVECFIDNNWVEFGSAKEASIKLNLNRSKIVMVCNGKRNSTGGYKFRYKINTDIK